MVSILHLPNEILCKIMEYVSTNERHSVATVCIRFANVMEIPRLWRNQEFDFEGQLFIRSRNRELNYTCRFQSHWKHLDLRFRRLTRKSADRFKKLTANLNREFNDIWKLKRMTVIFEKEWHNEVARRIFVQNFFPIFYHQSRLTEVNIAALHASQLQGCQILRALLDGCGSTITTLRLVQFFHIYNADLSDDFENGVTSFTNLRHLELNYCYLSSSLLHLLAVRLPGQLETLTLGNSSRSSRKTLKFDPKLSQAYAVLSQACPKLSVNYKFVWELSGVFLRH